MDEAVALYKPVKLPGFSAFSPAKIPPRCVEGEGGSPRAGNSGSRDAFTKITIVPLYHRIKIALTDRQRGSEVFLCADWLFRDPPRHFDRDVHPRYSAHKLQWSTPGLAIAKLSSTKST